MAGGGKEGQGRSLMRARMYSWSESWIGSVVCIVALLARDGIHGGLHCMYIAMIEEIAQCFSVYNLLRKMDCVSVKLIIPS